MSLPDITRALLDAVLLVAAVLGIVLTIGLAVRILFSVWRVTIGKATLVLPLQGSSKGPAVSSVLAQQLDQVESKWMELSRQIHMLEPPRDDAPIFGEIGRSLPDKHLDKDQEQFIEDNPMNPQVVGTIGFAGLTLTPQVLFSLLYAIRSSLTRRSIRGTLHEFDTIVRLSVTFYHAGSVLRPPPLISDLKAPAEMLDLVDDVAFSYVKFRMDLHSEAHRWAAYRAFLEGYVEQHRFLTTGDTGHREAAIQKYQQAIVAEPDYSLAHYNMGTLLYTRYTPRDNSSAIEHLLKAATAAGADSMVSAPALALVAICYCQQVHRYGYPTEPWATLAEEASARAYGLDSTLEETSYARAFSSQVHGQLDAAMNWYKRVVELPGNTAEERQMKSFALNNTGFLHLSKGNLQQAEASLRRALDFSPNKMAFANLGEIYRKRGLFDQSLDEYKRALTLDPRYIHATNETGMVYVSMARVVSPEDKIRCAGHLALAHQWHQRALSLVSIGEHEQRAELHRRFGQAYRESGFEKEADGEFTNAAAERAQIGSEGRADPLGARGPSGQTSSAAVVDSTKEVHEATVEPSGGEPHTEP